MKAISSFRNSSFSSRIDGISPQHIKDSVSKSAGKSGSKLLKAITKLTNLMLHGKVQPNILKLLYEANVCALDKNNGGLCPFSVGCTFRRISTKI